MKYLFIILSASMLSLEVKGQKQFKKRVYAEIGLGAGQTLFFGDIRERLNQSLGGAFEPGIGNNLMMAFYVAPESFNGLGIGSRIKGTFGSSVEGENDNDQYIFNYYNLAASLKYYFLSREYNKGIYARTSYGFGQLTSKRVNDDVKRYRHQYAIGSTSSLGIGYTLPLKSTTISLEVEVESSSRNGTIDGVGNASFRSGQLGANVIITF